MAVWYLDNDDEITDAVARLRGTGDELVVFVVPPGSRIATGRINFKLLAREAESRHKRMAVASPDEQVRALAGSAGVLAEATPDLAEAALERGDQPHVTQAEADADEIPAATGTTAAAGTAGRGRLAWRSQRVRITTVAVLALAVVAIVVGTQTLPTAEITLTPRAQPLGPLSIEVVAQAGIEETDVESGRVPAAELAIPLAVEDTFVASGTETTANEKATGEVIFTAPALDFDRDIPEGTRLATPSDIVFFTTSDVTLPRTVGGTGPTVVAAPVEAAEAGAEGNVDPGIIRRVPSALAEQDISVQNPEATSGGRLEVKSIVTRQDYDRAAAELENRLLGMRDAYLQDPENVPAGLELYAESARSGTLTLQPPPDELIGVQGDDFELAATIEASVLAIDPVLVSDVLRARIRAAVPADSAILDGSISVQPGKGSADGQRIRFDGTASAAAYPLVDADALTAEVAGLPIPEARSILEGIGKTTVNVWPDFIGDLPDDRDRITLEVLGPSTTE